MELNTAFDARNEARRNRLFRVGEKRPASSIDCSPCSPAGRRTRRRPPLTRGRPPRPRPSVAPVRLARESPAPLRARPPRPRRQPPSKRGRPQRPPPLLGPRRLPSGSGPWWRRTPALADGGARPRAGRLRPEAAALPAPAKGARVCRNNRIKNLVKRNDRHLNTSGLLA